MENNRNLFLTIALSVGILALWQFFYVNPRIEEQRQAQIESQAQLEQATPATEAEAGDIPAATVTPGTAASDIPQSSIVEQNGDSSSDRAGAVASDGRVAIETELLKGSINLTGARFDDLSLKNYHIDVDQSSPIVDLLTPAGVQNAYFGEFGYTGFEGAPGPSSNWTLESGTTLTPGTPVTLSYAADNGLAFNRTISIDDGYMFTIEDTITNGGAGAISFQDYGRTTRFFKPEAPPIFILHEGMVGVTGEKGLLEYTFSEIEDDQEVALDKSTDGWLGITDKYWATALIPADGRSFQPRYQYLSNGIARYQSDFLSDPIAINPGQTETVSNWFFAGAKKTEIIDAYERDLGIRQFELMIDWGWFHLITKPLFTWIMFPLFNLIGNFGVAILMTTVIVKAVFFPLASKSYASMARMKVVQPRMQEIKEKYGEDREKMQKAMMELYKKEKINPIAGCWPMLIQIPVFFALYKVIYITIEMRHAPFFGWIQDLSAPDPSSVWELFGLIPWGAADVLPAFVMLGVWPLLMGITMFIQMQMNPAPPDPTQAMIFRWMPVVFTFMLSTFPAGLVIYWAWNNFLSIIQQGYIMKKNGAEIALVDNVKAMFGRGPKPAE